MNININQLREALDVFERLAGTITGSGPDNPGPQPAPFESRLVLVRGDRSGVFYGTIVSEEGQVVEITDARHVWSWAGALNVADLAEKGPSGGKITGPTKRIRVLDAIEVCDVSKAAAAQFDEVTPWVK